MGYIKEMLFPKAHRIRKQEMRIEQLKRDISHLRLKNQELKFDKESINIKLDRQLLINKRWEAVCNYAREINQKPSYLLIQGDILRMLEDYKMMKDAEK